MDWYGNIVCPAGPGPWNFTDETKDQVRTWYCGAQYANITVQMFYNYYWPSFFVYDGTGDYYGTCFKLTVEGDASLSIYQGGLYYWDTTDFYASNCFSYSVATFEIRSILTYPFSPRYFSTNQCQGTVVMKTYTGIAPVRSYMQSRRIAFRNFRGNFTFNNNGNIHYWVDWIPSNIMELGNWAGFEPVWNIYGVFWKLPGQYGYTGTQFTRTVLQSSTSNVRMIWHQNSTVRIDSTWWMNDLRPQQGPNMMNGYVLINNTQIQIEGNWVVGPTADINGIPGGNNNFTYVAGTATTGTNTLTLAGNFTNLFFFGNTSNINYLTTGTFNNVSAILTDRCSGWTWNRQNVPGIATFANVQLGKNTAITLTLRDGLFAFDTLTGPGTVTLVNAQLTVGGNPYVAPPKAA